MVSVAGLRFRCLSHLLQLSSSSFSIGKISRDEINHRWYSRSFSMLHWSQPRQFPFSVTYNHLYKVFWNSKHSEKGLMKKDRDLRLYKPAAKCHSVTDMKYPRRSMTRWKKWMLESATWYEKPDHWWFTRLLSGPVDYTTTWIKLLLIVPKFYVATLPLSCPAGASAFQIWILHKVAALYSESFTILILL